MFTRYASLDSAQVLDVRSAPTQQRTASLDKLSEFNKYRTDDGYVYVRIRAISSRVNKNHDGWPAVELAGSPEIFKRHQAGTGFTVEASDGNPKYGFATFIHKPIFVDHNNTDPDKARGVIRDSKLRVLDHHTSASDDYWKSSNVDPEHLPATEVELLLEIDAKHYPKFAMRIVNGDLDGFSMGANVGKTKCSHCGNIATDPTEFCSHVLMKGATHDYTSSDGKKVSKKSYENCYDVQFFEISGVFDPADPTALAREVRSAVINEHGYDQVPDPVRPDDEAVMQRAEDFFRMGIDPANAKDLAAQQTKPKHIHDEGGSSTDFLKQWMYNNQEPPKEMRHLQYPELDEEGNFAGYPHNDPRWSKTAENDLPQEFKVRAPDEVDTLRDEQICPICGSPMTGTTCDVCQYTKPPKSYDNPDLNKALEIRQQMKEMDDPTQPQNGPPTPQQDSTSPNPSQMPTKTPSTAAVTNDMQWTPILHPKTAALINNNEQPVSATNRPLSNDTQKETVVSDQTKPVTASMLTAKQLIEKARNNQMNTRTADGATPLPEASPKQRVDVTGVGSVDQGSNEEASKARAQVDVTGIGGTGVTDVKADETTNLPEAGRDSDDAGFNKDKTTEDSGPTKTFDRYDGTEDGAREPVTNESLEEQEQQGGSKGPVSGKPSYSHERHAYDDKTLEQNEQQGDPIAQGGSANQGTQPVDPVATDSYRRVNVLEHETSPENNSGPTTTWTGTDGNGVLKQQPPVTKEQPNYPGEPASRNGYPGPPSGGPSGESAKPTTQAGTIRINALQVLEAEEELGLVPRESKWRRCAELNEMSDVELNATLNTYSRVTARVSKLASATRTSSVTKVPRMFGKQTSAPDGFERIASEQPKEEPVAVSDDSLDSAVFLR